MKIKKIFIGSWYSRTQLHLDELFLFLGEGKSHLSLDKEKLSKHRKNLNPSTLAKFFEKGHEMLTAKLGKYDFEYHENGLLLMSVESPGKDAFKEMKLLSGFTMDKVLKAFGFLYSQGAPIPKIFIALKSVLPYVILTEGTTRGEIKSFFTKREVEIKQEIKNDQTSIYIGETMVVIDGPVEKSLDFVRTFYLLNDANSQLKKVLDLHRFIWEEIDKVKSKGKIRYRDLSLNRDTLMEINNEIIFFKSRLEQVENVLMDEKSEYVINMKSKMGDKIVLHFTESFDALNRTAVYVKNLWNMTENYASNTFNLINLLYQESSSKQINILQFIFVISAVASIITMGSVYGFSISLFDNAGLPVLQGETVSFAFYDLMRFGGAAILIGSFLYFIFTFVYNKFAASRITDTRLMENKEFERIKKMLGE